MDNIEIQIVVFTKYGEFRGKKAIMNYDQWNGLLEIAKKFYINGGFELTLEDGGFIVIPPDVISDSVLKILKNKIDNDSSNI